MAKIEASIFESLRALTLRREGDLTRFAGTMFFSPALEGPPGRVHGGIHPLVRTLPILARVRGEGALPERVWIDAELGQGLPLSTEVSFEGSYVEDGAGLALTTRFLESDRLVATAKVPSGGGLSAGDALERFRRLFALSEGEEGQDLRVLGVPYRITPSVVLLDLRSREGIEPRSHLARCFGEDGAVGLTALCTQLDAIGATARGVLMRHPHFTRRITLGFDVSGLEAETPLLLIADRTGIREVEGSARVVIDGVGYGGAITEVIAVDAGFQRCHAHGFVASHPVDPARFAGFEGMRKLREL